MVGADSYSFVMFCVFAALAVLPTLGILLAKDIVRQAFWLLTSLAGFAGLYLHMGADFLGFMQVVVYIGGILILFLFGVMLTHRMDIPLKDVKGFNLVVPGVVAGIVAAAALFYVIFQTSWSTPEVPRAMPTVADVGQDIMSEFILPFEVVSVVLLVALVGATYIARRDEEDEEAEE